MNLPSRASQVPLGEHPAKLSPWGASGTVCDSAPRAGPQSSPGEKDAMNLLKKLLTHRRGRRERGENQDKSRRISANSSFSAVEIRIMRPFFNGVNVGFDEVDGTIKALKGGSVFCSGDTDETAAF